MASSRPAPAPADSSGWVRRLWRHVAAHRADLALSVLGALLGCGCQTVVPLVERHIVDGVVSVGGGLLWPWVLALVALAAGIFAFAYLRRFFGGRVALGVQYDLRNAMHDHLQAMDATNLGHLPTGQLVGRANSDLALVRGLLSFLPVMSSNVVLVALSLAVMVWLSPLLAVVSLVVVPALLALSYRMRVRMFPATWDAQQREGDLVQIVDEDLGGVRVVKAFGQERRELERLAGTARSLYRSEMRTVRLQARYQPVLQAVPAAGQVAILALGGWLALHHRISLGTFLAFSTYVTQLVAPARRLAGILTTAQQARAGAERIFQLLDLRPAIADAPGAVELGDVRGDLSFCDVHVAYEGGPPALAGFDLHVPAGSCVALVGRSGSGKSTVVQLVARLLDPDQGAVLLDGHDLREVTLASLRQQVGIAFEESFLFSQSVRDNIAYGRPGASEAEVVAAARAAGAHGFITRLPDGYDTVVGERGLTLSGGQRQRVALARTLLHDPRVVVLDDATSAVDARTEEAIHDALRRALAGRTTVLVAHRRSTLRLADRVVVVEAGRVVAAGTHDELLESSPLYRTLLGGLDPVEAGVAEGRIEVLAARAGGGVPTGADGGAAPRAAARAGARTWRANLAPSPELLARVAALPPLRDPPEVDLDVEARPDPRFSLARLLGEFRRPLAVGLALVVLDALATLAGPVLVKTGVDQGVRAGAATVLFAASAAYLLVTAADLVDQIGETFVTGRTAQRIMLSLRLRIWAQLQRLSLDYYESELAGRIMTRMTTDVDQFESLIENGVLQALVSIVTFVGVGIALLVMNPLLGACTLSVIVPLGAATGTFRRRAATLYDLARERVAIVNADFQESLAGVREAQAFGHEAATMGRFHQLGRDYLDARVAAQRLVALYFPFVAFLAGVADAIALGVGAGLVGSGRLTAGALIAFVLYIDLFFSPIQQLSQVFDSWQQTRVSVGRVADLMRIETGTPAPAAPVVPGPLRGALRLEGVRFAYPAPRPRPARGWRDEPPAAERRAAGAAPSRPPEALRGLHLEVAPGETVALVGETGAGKSTVVKLLARFYDPDGGRVTIDGHDLRTLDLHALRCQLGYVPQEGFLFSGSIRDNIAYGRPDATDAEVESAARAVGAHDVIAALPGGYRHELGERGRSLSAGQRQLIALARAQLVDPAVLLLDEATANLDLVSEARVAAAMRRVSQDRTTVLIAHRLQTARNADRIVVLEDGRVVESGRHDELVAVAGRYAAMWEAFELAGEEEERAAAG